MIHTLLLTALIGLAGQLPHVHIVPDSVKSKPIHLTQNGREITLHAREMQLKISLPSGKTGQADVLMLYEPHNKLFWWTYENREGVKPGGITERFLSQSVLYVTKDKIVGFSGGAFLTVHESSEDRASMDEGQNSVLATIENTRTEIEQGELQGYREINIAKSLNPDFLHLRGSAAPFPMPKLRSVTMTRDEWRLVLDGPNGDSAVVLLDDKYNVISAQVQPQANSK